MARLASPALGCRLRLVEVEVNVAKEIYDPRHFEEPLELNIEGQRSLGSNYGILLLVITTGTRQMLSIRLNDLLDHPNGTEGTICMDKGEHKLCVKLPDRDHILRVWFVEQRDFLISVCILRKSGFKIDEGEFGQPKNSTATRTENARANRTPRTTTTTTTPLSMLTAQAKALCNEPTTSAPKVRPVGKNIFDEVLESLQRLGGDSRSQDTECRNLSSADIEPADLSYLDPYHVFSTKKKLGLSEPKIGSPLRNITNNQQQGQSETQHLQANVAATPRAATARRHGYFTRSFSSSHAVTRQNNKERLPASSLSLKRTASTSAEECNADNMIAAVSGDHDSRSAIDIRQLMPQRRSLPFSATCTQNVTKKLKPTVAITEVQQHDDLMAPATAPDVTQTRKPRVDTQETIIILTQPSILDRLDEVSCGIFEQYEKDIADGCDEEHCAEFYLGRLYVARTDFWLRELVKAATSDCGTLIEV